MNPYEGLREEAFWRKAVGNRNALLIAGLPAFRRKLKPTEGVATAGSCFAQHIARRLRSSGFNYVDVEPAPSWLAPARRNDFGYEMFSARYGNVYTTTQLRQLLLRATGGFVPKERVWHTGGRWYDPFRPSIEPDGFGTEAEALLSQDDHLRAVKRLMRTVDVFVFTLGLTETWRSKEDGAVYPSCPGVQGGEFDAAKYEFVNLDYAIVERDLRASMTILRKFRPEMRFILTVSPVPLVATASRHHVLTATTYSKSVLRAVAGHLSDEFEYVDYFPSYEIIASPPFGGRFYDPDQRGVCSVGVDHVMKTFFGECCEMPASPLPVAANDDEEPEEADVKCDEEVLNFYAR